jgi:hypothetical protein
VPPASTSDWPSAAVKMDRSTVAAVIEALLGVQRTTPAA